MSRAIVGRIKDGHGGSERFTSALMGSEGGCKRRELAGGHATWRELIPLLSELSDGRESPQRLVRQSRDSSCLCMIRPFRMYA